MSQSNHKVSIIIINYKTPELTQNCIASLYKTETYKNKEIILLDNYSRDDTVDRVHHQFPEVKCIIANQNLGFAGGNNRAAKIADGKYLCFLNSDTVITQPFIQPLVSYLEQHEHTGIVAPRLRNQDGTIQESVFKFPTLGRAFCESFFLSAAFSNNPIIGDYRHFDYQQEKEVGFVSGACFMLSNRLFKQLEGFDERFFMYAEETDLAFRAYKHGFKSAFLPVGDITHLGGGSNTIGKKYNPVFFRSKVKYYHKHYGFLGLRLFLIMKNMGFIIRNIVLLFLGNWSKLMFNTRIIRDYNRAFWGITF